jgi:hypothetical protein
MLARSDQRVGVESAAAGGDRGASVADPTMLILCPNRDSPLAWFVARRAAMLRAWDELIRSGAAPEEIGALLHETVQQMRAQGGVRDRNAAE